MARSALSTTLSLAIAGTAIAQSDRQPSQLTLDDLFPTDRVLDVQIQVAKPDWKQLRLQSRTFQGALSSQRKQGRFDNPYTYVDAEVSIDGVNFGTVGIRKKGFIGSLSTSRPSLKIKLNHADKAGGIGGLTNLTLNNNQQDASLSSQFLAYSLFAAAGAPAPRCAFARVTVNGDYLGVYSHVESMRRPLLERCFGSADGVLFEGTVTDFFAGWAQGFERKSGKESRGRVKIEQLIEVLGSEREPEQGGDLEQAVAAVVELDAFYTFWALEGLLGCWDGYSGNKNNYFVYLHPETGLLHFLPWGADMLFMKYNPMQRDPEAPLSVKTSGLLAHRLYQLDSGRRRYQATMKRLLDEHWDEQALFAEADRLEALLEPHLGKTQRRAIDGLYELRDFVEQRRADMLAEIEGDMPLWNKMPGPPFVMPAAGEKWEASIWRAAKNGDVEALAHHVRAGADVNTISKDDGSRPLALAAVVGHVDAVRYLVEHGALVDATNDKGEAALHGAAFLGHVEVIEVLIVAGADLNAVTKDGRTPLDNAAVAWSEELAGIAEFVGMVLQVKFDLERVEARRPAAAALLTKHGARRGK